jgi:hypothetical protein
MAVVGKGIATAKRSANRAAGAAMSGLLFGAVAFALAPAWMAGSRWMGSLADLASPICMRGSIVVHNGYFEIQLIECHPGEPADHSPGDHLLH